MLWQFCSLFWHKKVLVHVQFSYMNMKPYNRGLFLQLALPIFSAKRKTWFYSSKAAVPWIFSSLSIKGNASSIFHPKFSQADKLVCSKECFRQQIFFETNLQKETSFVNTCYQSIHLFWCFEEQLFFPLSYHRHLWGFSKSWRKEAPCGGSTICILISHLANRYYYETSRLV